MSPVRAPIENGISKCKSKVLSAFSIVVYFPIIKRTREPETPGRTIALVASTPARKRVVVVSGRLVGATVKIKIPKDRPPKIKLTL